MSRHAGMSGSQSLGAESVRCGSTGISVSNEFCASFEHSLVDIWQFLIQQSVEQGSVLLVYIL